MLYVKISAMAPYVKYEAPAKVIILIANVSAILRTSSIIVLYENCRSYP